MRTALKWIAGVLATLVVALALFVAFGLYSLRGPITRAVTNATGRELVIDGRIRAVWSWLHPRFRVERVRFANADWAREDWLFSADAVEAEVRGLPLFAGAGGAAASAPRGRRGEPRARRGRSPELDPRHQDGEGRAEKELPRAHRAPDAGPGSPQLYRRGPRHRPADRSQHGRHRGAVRRHRHLSGAAAVRVGALGPGPLSARRIDPVPAQGRSESRRYPGRRRRQHHRAGRAQEDRNPGPPQRQLARGSLRHHQHRFAADA